MSFRNSVKIGFKVAVALLLLLLPLSGCSKGGSSISQPTIAINGASVSCLNGLGGKISGYFAGTDSENDVHAVWGCLNEVVTEFTQWTTGAVPGQYSASELQGFLEKYFFKGGLSDATLSTTMRLKQVLVGGSTEAITMAEIQSLLADISALDTLTSNLLPATAVVFAGANNTVTDTQWTSSYKGLTQSGSGLAALFSSAGQTYQISEIQALGQAWADQLDLPANHFVRTIVTLMPTIGQTKSVLIGGSAVAVASNEWAVLAPTLANSYSYYRMASRLLATSADASMTLESANFQWLTGSVVQLLANAVQVQPNQQIPLATVQTILQGLETSGLFPSSVTTTEAMSCLQFFVLKVFNSTQASATAIDQYHMAQMQAFLSRWQTIESALETQSFASVPDFDHSIHPGWPVSLDQRGRLEFPGSASSTALYRDYSILYTAVEWMGQQWGTWPMSVDNFHSMVTDVLSFLQSINIATGTNDDIYLKLDRYANLFTWSSNGDMLLDLPEAFQLSLYTLSSYRYASVLQTAVGSSCAASDTTCYQSFWYQNRTQLFAPSPLLVNWLNANQTEWSDYSNNLGIAGGTSEWLMQYAVVHFIEVYLERWDTNGDGVINLNEAMAAYPIYQGILTTMFESAYVPSNFVLPLYTFLFAYGEPYFSMGIGGDVVFMHWYFYQDTWQFSADRKTLAEILAQLSLLITQ